MSPTCPICDVPVKMILNAKMELIEARCPKCGRQVYVITLDVISASSKRPDPRRVQPI